MTSPYQDDILHYPKKRDHVLRALARVLPPSCLIGTPEAMRPYTSDGLPVFSAMPLAVAIPDNEQQLIATLRTLGEQGVPIVPRGGGTSLSGGAVPHPQGVVLSLARFKNIHWIDQTRRLCRAGTGVRNAALSEAAAPHGLFYAPDPSSQIACSLGGNIAENAGGIHCLKYGLTWHNVVSARLVCADGTVLEVGEETGFDPLPLVVGSEGLLGVVTEATVRLRPVPPCTRLLMAAFAQISHAGAAVAAIIAAGIVPAALELMDHLAIVASEAFCHAGYPQDAQAILLCELDGLEEQVTEDEACVRELLQRHRATSCRTAQNEAERALFWSGRKAAFPAAGRMAPDYYCMDGSIPRRALAAVLETIDDLSKTYDLEVMNVFHAGDGNLHPVILLDADDPDQLQRAQRLGSAILKTCLEAGGSITGEHGVGVEKLDEMCAQFTTTERERLLATKQAFDPAGLLNPGKGLPTLRRCAEGGALLVRGGQLPHPDLERF